MFHNLNVLLMYDKNINNYTHYYLLLTLNYSKIKIAFIFTVTVENTRKNHTNSYKKNNIKSHK